MSSRPPPPHIPRKEIKTLQQVAFYQHSEAYRRLMIFITQVNEAIVSKPLSTPLKPYHASLDKVLESLNTLDSVISKYPPVPMGQRYGNIAYRQWHADIEKVLLRFFCFSSSLFIPFILSPVGS